MQIALNKTIEFNERFRIRKIYLLVSAILVITGCGDTENVSIGPDQPNRTKTTHQPNHRHYAVGQSDQPRGTVVLRKPNNDLAPLGKLKNLRMLYLGLNNITADKKAMLKKALLNCDIYF
jgi:hypothetical protein